MAFDPVQLSPSCGILPVAVLFTNVLIQIANGLSNSNSNNYQIQPNLRSERLQKWLAPNYYEHYNPYSIFNQVHLWDTPPAPYSWEISPSSRRGGFNGKPQTRRRKQLQTNYNTNSHSYGDALPAGGSRFNAYDNQSTNSIDKNVMQVWATTDAPPVPTTTSISIVHEWPQQNVQPNFYEYSSNNNNLPLNDAPQHHYQPPPPPSLPQQQQMVRRTPDTKGYTPDERPRSTGAVAAATPDVVVGGDTAISRYRALQSSASTQPRLSSSPSVFQQRSASYTMKNRNPFSVLEAPSFSFSFSPPSSFSSTKGNVINAAPLHSFSFSSPILSSNPGNYQTMYSSSSSVSNGGGNEKGPRTSSSSSQSMQWAASRSQRATTLPQQHQSLTFPPAPPQTYWHASMQVQQPPFVGSLQPQQQLTKAQNNMRGPQPPLTVISLPPQPSFSSRPSAQQQQQTKGETRLQLPPLEPLSKSPPSNFGFGGTSSFGQPPAPNNFASDIKAGFPPQPQQPGTAIYDQPTIRCYQCRVPTDRECGPASVVQPCAWVFQPDSCFNASVQYVPVEDGLTGIIPPSKAPEKVYDCKTTVAFPVMFLRHFHIGQNECKSYSGYTITTSAVVGGEQRDYKYELQGNICTCATDACNQA